ncbi:MAG: phytanoyl-CoA dioxygenase family protein [Pseudomonadota bacterium]
MSVPIEFTPEYVQKNSPKEELLYTDFIKSGEPFRSMMANNPWLIPPDVQKPLEQDGDHYWNTTVARKHPYWSKIDLPKPTKKIRQLRKDLRDWGFCLIEDAMSEEQCEAFYAQLWRQSEGEQAASVAHQTPSGQQINTLVNKGECFARCIEQHPSAVQAGPVIEQIMDETLGKGWICHSFLAIGADPGGYPQGLHIDQGPLLPWLTEDAPALVNTMYIPQDTDETNGGTLIIPGSHKILIEAGTGGKVGKLPPAINLEAKAGTAMLFDGRIMHGTGVNHSNKRRYVAVMSNVKSWMRTQENWVLSVAPDVLDKASPKLRHRMGFQAVTYGSTIEGFGMGARGRAGDVWGDIAPFRAAYDRGEYHRVRELGPDSSEAELNKGCTIKDAMERLEEARKQARDKTQQTS